ncbi:hypothetical protein GCM10023155_50670 [Bremerella cremea]
MSERRQPGDLVLDLDRIKQAITGDPLHVTNQAALRVAIAMWTTAIKELKRKPFAGVVYVETTEPDPARRRYWCGELTAQQVLIHSDQATCLARLEASPERATDREGIEGRIAQWFAENST